VNAISGYSGGGKALMAVYENEKEPCEPWGAYGFGLAHKHLAEMALYSRLGVKPIFQVLATLHGSFHRPQQTSRI
jgi:N-acetyl-gamma-glutamyl-phosphate reductase